MRLMLTTAVLALAAPALAETRDFPVGGFAQVMNEGAADMLVTVGGAPSVRADGDPARLAALDVRVEGDRLVVRTRPGARWPQGRSRTVVRVTVPRLAAAAASGSGDVRIDTVAGAGFSGSAHGSGNLVIGALRVDRADLSSHGSGNLVAAGTVGRLDAFASGSGNVDARGVTAKSARVRTTGSGNIDASASEEADLIASGSGNATVLGTRTCRVRGTGSGSVKCG